MAISLLQRSDSIGDLPQLPAADEGIQDMRESAKKAAAAVSKSGCAVGQVGAGVGLGLAGQPVAAAAVPAGMKLLEEPCIHSCAEIIDSGFVDGGLQRTHAMTNTCVIL